MLTVKFRPCLHKDGILFLENYHVLNCSKKILAFKRNLLWFGFPLVWLKIPSASPLFLPSRAGGSRKVWPTYFPEEYSEVHLISILQSPPLPTLPDDSTECISWCLAALELLAFSGQISAPSCHWLVVLWQKRHMKKPWGSKLNLSPELL